MRDSRTKQLALRLICACALIVQMSAANANWFAGVGVGSSKNEDYDCIGCGPVGTVDDSGLGYKVFGGYRFHGNVAVVSGFVQLADTEAAGPLPFADQLEVNGPYIAAIGTLPLSANFELFSTLGVFRWNQDVTYNGSSGSFNGTDLTYSVGAGYNFSIRGTPRIALQAEWQRFMDVGTNDALLGHIDNYSLTTLNLVYRFR